MANFDDLDPLSQEAEIELIMIKAGQAIPADIDLVLIPGSKSTIDDLSFLREQGWDIDLKAHHRRGGSILGICGGYQMLGTKICDPDGIEGAAGEIEGLGFLQIQTVMQAGKTVRVVSATHFATSVEIKGHWNGITITSRILRYEGCSCSDCYHFQFHRCLLWP